MFKSFNRRDQDYIIDIVIPFMFGMLLTIQFVLYGLTIWVPICLATIIWMSLRNPKLYKKLYGNKE